MKYLPLFALVLVGFFGCSNNTDCCTDIPNNYLGNKLAYLKLDYTTNEFQGGKVFSFGDDEPSTFQISSSYNPPGDFGDVELYFEPLNEMIFQGTIIWMGLGEMQYPQTLLPPDSFEVVSTPVTIPSEDLFTKVMYDEFSFYPETINYSGIWESIDHLELVKAYRSSNPGSEVKLFLYTPSVGVGNPEDWYWLVILKN